MKNKKQIIKAFAIQDDYCGLVLGSIGWSKKGVEVVEKQTYPKLKDGHWNHPNKKIVPITIHF